MSQAALQQKRDTDLQRFNDKDTDIMVFNLNDKVVLITGSTGGLGKATAKALLEKGAKLALLDLDPAAIQAQVEELGGEAYAFGCAANVCSLKDLEQCFAAVCQHFGRIDVVIANAGVGYTEPLETMTEQSFEKIIDINLSGVFRTFKAALPYVTQTRGHLLAVSSMAAFVNAPLNAHYAATKAGVLAFCNSLRVELRHLGISVGTIHPTFFKTPMTDAIMDSHCSKLVFNNYRGIWKFVDAQKVVQQLVESIEQRKQLVTAPSGLWVVAKASGLLRPLVEKIGFRKDRVEKAVRQTIAEY